MQAGNSLPDIRKLVLINAPIADVWRYISSAEGIASWWMPNTFEPVLGHGFMLHASDVGDLPCTVTEYSPPKGRHARVGFDWGKDWHLTFRLVRFSSITEFTLIHSGWGADKVTELGRPHPALREVMNSGWDEIVTGTLPKVVEGNR